jgi:hypothetical protein
MGLSNAYHLRPKSPTMPSWFQNPPDDGSYKLKSSATVSYVVGPDGNIVPGSADVTYDDRSGDTHLPKFVMDLLRAIEQDYGITQPDLSYASVNSHEYDHQTTWAVPNLDGVLPGRAFKHAGAPPVVMDANGVPTTAGGRCVASMHIAGGMIGYRPMIDTGYVGNAVLSWKNRVYQSTAVPQAVKHISADIYGSFFQPGGITIVPGNPPVATITGSPMANAQPIWQELGFLACVDGTIKPFGADKPVLRASHMPNQYLYLNGESIGLDGARNYTSSPIISGSFPKFTNIPDPAIGFHAWPNQFGACGPDTEQNGNPWDLALPLPGDLNPNAVHFCTYPGADPDPEYD